MDRWMGRQIQIQIYKYISSKLVDRINQATSFKKLQLL